MFFDIGATNKNIGGIKTLKFKTIKNTEKIWKHHGDSFYPKFVCWDFKNYVQIHTYRDSSNHVS